MRTILAHLEISPVLDSILASTLIVAKRYNSYIEGFHMRPGQPDVIAAGADGFVAAAPDLVAGFEREAKERADRAAARFEAFMGDNGLKRPGMLEASGLCADWRVETASGPSALGSRGRIFDLLVLGRPLDDEVTPSIAALEAALFDSGRPLLVVPPEPPQDFGKHVVIAWNGSTETARTIGFAERFLVDADRVTVLTVEKGSVPGPSGADLAHNLGRRGIAADFREAPLGNRQVGEAILDETLAIGGDFLLKGAYTQSRLRQMIFGGATSYILAKATLPVIMAN
jgi:nucleotide-binding universal stress UspA family protein